MSGPAPAAIFAALEATWPAARRIPLDPFVLRAGAGGGKRVSAATPTGPADADAIDAAADAMRALDQPALFRLEQGGGDLDLLLADKGYEIADPTLARACPIAALCDPVPPPVTGFAVWEPLQIMRDIWAEGGIGPARVAVMDRVAVPKTALLGRTADKPAAAAFVAVHDGIAMLHALEVRPHLRRRGAGLHLMRHAALWARDHGAHTMAILVVAANGAANALYERLGMPVCARYHYRIRKG